MDLQGGSFNPQKTFSPQQPANVPIQAAPIAVQAQPVTIQSAPVIQQQQAPATTYIAPAAKLSMGKAFNPFQELDNKISYFISDGNQRNPLTNDIYKPGQVVFEAPDYVINSDYFKNVIDPMLDKPVVYDGEKANHEILTEEFKEIVDDARDYAGLVRDYTRFNLGSTEKEAVVYLRNIAAANASNSDEKTQVVWGINEDGSEKVTSVKTLVDTFKSYDDFTLGSMVKNYEAQLANPNTTPAQKAVLLSLLQFAQQKKLLGASGKTQLEIGLKNFLANSDEGGVSGLVNEFTRIGNDGTAAAQATRDLAVDPRTSLEGLENAEKAGSIAGTGLSLAGDIFGGGALGSGINSAANLTRVGRALDRLRQSSSAGRATASTIRETPTNLFIGALQAPANEGSFNQNLAIDTAITAGLFGGARAAVATAKSLDTAANGALTQISDEIAKAGFRGLDTMQNLPLVGKAMKRLSFNLVDDSAGVTRAARNAFANSVGETETKATKNYYIAVSNALRQASMRGFPESTDFMRYSAPYKQAFETNQALRKASDADIQRANEYVNDTTVLSRIESGQYKAPEAYTENLRAKIASFDTPELQEYRRQVSAFNDDITKFEVEAGISNEDILKYMDESPDFAKEYVALQADIKRQEGFTPNKNGGSLKSAQAGKRIKGLSEDVEYMDPFLVATDRLRAVTEMASRNRVTTLLKNGIDNGWISGTVLQDAALTKERGALKAAVTAERKAIDNSLVASLDDLDVKVTQLLDDIEDPLGDGVALLTTQFDAAINTIVDNIVADDLFIKQVLNKLPEGTDPRQAALEALSISKNQVNTRVGSIMANTELGKVQRDKAVELFKDRINLLTTRATSESTSGIADKYDEIRKLRDAISPDRTTKGEDVLAYFDNGGKGYIQISDPDVLEYFNLQKSIKEDGLFAKLLTGTSRLFRLGTTGLDPRFLLVNASRDLPQSAILSGYGALSPRNTINTLIDEAGLSIDEARRVKANNDRLFESSFRHSTEYSSARNPEKGYKLLESEDRKNRSVVGKDVASRAVSKAKRYAVDAAVPTRMLRNAEDLMGETEILTRKNVFTSRFDSAIRRGQSVEDATQEALFYAAETTANFLRRGARVRQVIRTMPYLSAAINGKASFMRLWALDPLGVTARLATGIAAPALYIAVDNLRDPETAKGYFEIPDYTRETNFIVMTGPDSYISIPMSYEIASVINPFREMVEKQYGMDNESFKRIFVEGLLNQSPIDLGGFTEQDVSGNTDYARGIARAGSSILPQAFKPAYEVASGQEIYTGTQLGPTDEELIEQGAVGPMDEIKDSDRTFASRNSRALGFLADSLGIPQSTIQNVFKNYTGTVGQYLINGIDRLSGAPEDEIGGKDLGSNIAKTFGGAPAGRSRTAFYDGVDKLEGEKKNLEARLEKISLSGGTEEEINAQRKTLLDAYGKKVGDFANDFGDYYQRVGGVRPYQVDTLVRLLNFAPKSGVFDAGSYQAGDLQQSYFDASTQANQRANALGLPGTQERDLFGEIKLLDDGTPLASFDNVSRELEVLRSAGFGTPKQAIYDIEQLTKSDGNAGIESLGKIRSRYYDLMSPLFAKAQGLKGAAATAVYNEISAIQEQYNAEVLRRVKPVIDKYGVNLIRNNKKAMEAISEYIVVPGDFKPFASRKKQPYLSDDSEAYLKDLLGVGAMNTSAVPSDAQVVDSIATATNELNAGKRQSALYRLNGITQKVDEGNLYADYQTMEQIKSLIAAANKR